jgi:hypothetical protein
MADVRSSDFARDRHPELGELAHQPPVLLAVRISGVETRASSCLIFAKSTAGPSPLLMKQSTEPRDRSSTTGLALSVVGAKRGRWKRRSGLPTSMSNFSAYPHILCLGLFQHRNVGVSLSPEGKKVLVAAARLDRVSCQRVGPAELKLRQCR